MATQSPPRIGADGGTLWDTGDLLAALTRRFPPEAARVLLNAYAPVLPPSYAFALPAEDVAADIGLVEAADVADAPVMRLRHRPRDSDSRLHLCVCWPGHPAPLSDVLPLLENFGMRVASVACHDLRAARGRRVRVDHIRLLARPGWRLPVPAGFGRLEDGLAAVWGGRADNDGLNALCLVADLTWWEVVMIRALCRYLKQTGLPLSTAYLEGVLTQHAEIARLLVDSFRARHDSELSTVLRRQGTARCEAALATALDAVVGLDEDRILGGLHAVIQASVRTNAFRPAPGPPDPDPPLTVKFDSSRLSLLAPPRPLFETWVHSPRVDGIHLRGARVARGGIRWSDRPEDLRTEVLGLLKAQMVKNAGIVPQGAKGGFVVRRPPVGASRNALAAEARDCYRAFVGALLDITDNDKGGRVTHPDRVVCHDGPDPYLVVAADKGTAAMSDTANEVALRRGFWLGDAFASGGSNGYDHKRLGITARGAWESVRRHFGELGVDDRRDAFTVVGVGDMSGDVFGNGMLSTDRIRLVAAFDSRHIFLDPDPDPAASYAERRRLFDLASSSWADYDRKRISVGGGVFRRTVKSIPLSPQVRDALDIDAAVLAPAQLIQAILRAPVDLLWNGGVGTFVKATDENSGEVGDRSTDSVRVNGADLRCRVVAEGGNLGLTQRGRIEYALGGGRLNTDFIDNSAGVNLSDREVNLKVLLDDLVADDALSREGRAAALAEAADEVTRLVLADSARQVQAISATDALSAVSVDRHLRLLADLEAAGRLDRRLELLPDDATLRKRQAAGRGLTRPEIATLLAYSKNVVRDELLESNVPEDPYVASVVSAYLPQALGRQCGRYLPSHRLRREIAATLLATELVNRMGSSFVLRMEELTGAPTPDVVRVFMVAWDVLGLGSLWATVERLDVCRFAREQTGILVECRHLVENATLWLLRNRRQPLDVSAEVAGLRPRLAGLLPVLPGALVGAAASAFEDRVALLRAAGLVPALAGRVALLGEPLAAGLDIVEVAAATGADIADTARVYFGLGEALDFDWLHAQVVELATESHWELLAKASLRADLQTQRRRLTAAVLAAAEAAAADPSGQRRVGGDPAGGATGRPAGRPAGSAWPGVERWQRGNDLAVRRCRTTLAALRSPGRLDVAMLYGALQELRNLLQSCEWNRGSD